MSKQAWPPIYAFNGTKLLQLLQKEDHKQKKLGTYFLFPLFEIIHLFLSLSFKVVSAGKSWAKGQKEIAHQCQLTITI